LLSYGVDSMISSAVDPHALGPRWLTSSAIRQLDLFAEILDSRLDCRAQTLRGVSRPTMQLRYALKGNAQYLGRFAQRQTEIVGQLVHGVACKAIGEFLFLAGLSQQLLRPRHLLGNWRWSRDIFNPYAHGRA
jgi:hypothetical protein